MYIQLAILYDDTSVNKYFKLLIAIITGLQIIFLLYKCIRSPRSIIYSVVRSTLYYFDSNYIRRLEIKLKSNAGIKKLITSRLNFVEKYAVTCSGEDPFDIHDCHVLSVDILKKEYYEYINKDLKKTFMNAYSLNFLKEIDNEDIVVDWDAIDRFYSEVNKDVENSDILDERFNSIPIEQIDNSSFIKKSIEIINILRDENIEIIDNSNYNLNSKNKIYLEITIKNINNKTNININVDIINLNNFNIFNLENDIFLIIYFNKRIMFPFILDKNNG